MMSWVKARWLIVICLVVAAGCDEKSGSREAQSARAQSELASDAATFLDFKWQGEVVGSYGGTNSYIDEQLKWTIGQLNGHESVGRIDHVELSNVSRSGDLITYQAKMVVAWGKSDIPESYTFRLPRSATATGLSSFLAKYKVSCMGDTHGEEPTLGDAWYYYRPNNASCVQDAEDTVTFVAEVSPNNDATEGRYPEYHKVWEDNTLRIVAIFGKVEEDGDASDQGYRGFNRMVYQVYEMLAPHNVETDPANLQTESGYYPDAPAPEVTDVEIRGTLPDGKRVVANIFSVPAIRSAGEEFYRRYEALSAAADFISYNGHSGLGSNIRTLAAKGKWVRDQYTIVLMNGCTTFAYVDSALADAHRSANPDDATGDRYLDIFTNARPAYFSYNVQGVMAIVNALMSFDTPQTYEQILSDFHLSQVALVSGEEDNVYSPEMAARPWSHFFEKASVPSKQWKHYGPFTVESGGILKVYTGGNHYAAEGVLNDADLYVRRGDRPTSSAYDCSSTSPHATEQCVVAGAGQYYVSVYAWTDNDNTEFDITVTYQSGSEDYCGDGEIGELEICDGNVVPCTEIDEIYTSGQASCQANCRGWDTSACLFCGDGRVDSPEVCDGNAVSCSEIDSIYVEGEAACNRTCSGYDVSNCVNGVGLVVVEESGNVKKDEWKELGPFSHLVGVFEVLMTGTGDADLYVRKGSRPTSKEYDCRPYKSTSMESCSLNGPGAYYVSVSGYKEDNDFALTIKYRQTTEGSCGDGVVDSGESCDGNTVLCVDLPGDYTSGAASCKASCDGYDESACRRDAQGEEVTVTESGSLAKEEFYHLGPFHHVEGEFFARITGTGDLDLYVKKGQQPTTSSYDCRPWDSGSDEQCGFDGPGDYYVSVYGYRAGNYELTVTYRR